MVSIPNRALLLDPFAQPIACPRRSMRSGSSIGVDDPKLLAALDSGDLRSKVLETKLRAAKEKFNDLEDVVAEFTKKLFHGTVAIHQESDPDYESNYIVVQVAASGDVGQLLALNDHWHRKIRDLVGEAADQFRLSIDVR